MRRAIGDWVRILSAAYYVGCKLKGLKQTRLAELFLECLSLVERGEKRIKID